MTTYFRHSSSSICVPSSDSYLTITTFLILSIVCHTTMLHPAPGLQRRVILAKGLTMILCPMIAVLFSIRSIAVLALTWTVLLINSGNMQRNPLNHQQENHSAADWHSWSEQDSGRELRRNHSDRPLSPHTQTTLPSLTIATQPGLQNAHGNTRNDGPTYDATNQVSNHSR